MTIDCIDCERSSKNEHYGTYTLKCAGCRERLVLNEPCKVLRQTIAQGLRKYGDEPEWKVEPSCGCKFACERMSNIRLSKHLSMM